MDASVILPENVQWISYFQPKGSPSPPLPHYVRPRQPSLEPFQFHPHLRPLYPFWNCCDALLSPALSLSLQTSIKKLCPLLKSILNVVEVLKSYKSSSKANWKHQKTSSSSIVVTRHKWPILSGKNRNYLRFLTHAGETGFPFFACGSLENLSHFWPRIIK